MLVRSSGVLYSDVMKLWTISNKITLFSSLLVVLVLSTRSRIVRAAEDDTSSSSSSPSSTSSSSDEEKGVPIIRQINKVNDDGTYTYGYEAADGSFKIETRDVLGNVKGMFGFIDESGELKRVSYTANNETGFKNSMLHPPTSTPYSTARPLPGSSSSSTHEPGRRPVLILKNMPSLHGSTKGPVIQHIPKKPASQKDDEEETSGSAVTNGRRFPSSATAASVNESQSEERNGVADDGKSHNPLRKVLVSKRPIDDKDIKGKGGNSLRRQLSRGGFDLRGEMSHIYAGGGDGRYSSSLPAHLDALMSELRPIQVVRTASPESIGYQTVDVEGVPQDFNEVSTTTELPPQPVYGSRKFVQPTGPPGYISRYRASRPHHVPVSEETQQYLQEVTPRQAPHHVPQPLPNVPQTLPLALNVPFGGQAGPNYQMQPHYYDQGAYSIPPSLRDELTAIIYNYLQVRLGPLGQSGVAPGYYPPQLGHPAAYPRLPYVNPYPYNSPLVNPIYSNPYPYAGNPYLGQQFYPYPNPAAGIYPVPSQTPYAGPNVQFSPRQELPHHRRLVPNNRLPTRAASSTDDADLLQMLLASPTRVPISQLKYSPTTERSLSPRVTQPIRNLQIITETTESRPVTTETTER